MKNHGLTRENHGLDMGLTRVIEGLNHQPDFSQNIFFKNNKNPEKI